MNDFLKRFFEKERIEFYRSVDMKDVKVINPRKLPSGVSTATVFLIPYGKCADVRNISHYAVPRDYHFYIKELSERLSEEYRKRVCDGEIFCFSDNSPINERELAVNAGLGFFGKNRLLINEKYGSFVFIGEILTREKLSLSSDNFTKRISCVSCGRCKKACPTGCLSGKNVCMSELTQKKCLSPDEEALVKEHYLVWGCDICQEVCPHNLQIPESPIAFFKEKRIPLINEKDIENMEKDAFSERAFAWRGKKTVLRNLSFKL